MTIYIFHSLSVAQKSICHLRVPNNSQADFHALLDDKQMRKEFTRYARFYRMIHLIFSGTVGEEEVPG